MIRFEDLTKNLLWVLRNEIVVNSLFLCDYENSFGYSKESLCAFFDGYYDYLWEIAQEEFSNPTHKDAMSLDNEENLWAWYNCYGDFDWVEYDNID